MREDIPVFPEGVPGGVPLPTPEPGLPGDGFPWEAPAGDDARIVGPPLDARVPRGNGEGDRVRFPLTPSAPGPFARRALAIPDRPVRP